MSTLHLYKKDQETDLNDLAQSLVDDFAYFCGLRRLPWMPGEVRQWLLDGFDAAVIREAIKRTSRAPRPSWSYLAAIIGYAKASHCFDMCDFLLKRHYSDDPLPM